MYIETDYTWSTHQPIIQSLMEIFVPRYILELGIGIYSTPTFMRYDFDKYIGIDNDKNWLGHITSSIKYDEHKCKFMYHYLNDDVVYNTLPKFVSSDLKENIKQYYTQLLKEVKTEALFPKLMFVDNFTCCRTLAINTLYDVFDIIVYHDDEPAGTPWYEYYFVEDIYKDYDKYTLITPRSWTSCFIRKNLSFSYKHPNDLTCEKIIEYRKNNGISDSNFRLCKI